MSRKSGDESSDDDDDYYKGVSPMKRHKLSHSSDSSSARAISYEKSGTIDVAEKVRRAAVVFRFLLSQSPKAEMDKFERAKTRLRFFYSPYSGRPLNVCGSFALFRDNSVRSYAPGKRVLLMNKFRNNLLDNRWIEVAGNVREYLKFPYNTAKWGTRFLCSIIIKPLTLSLCQPPITPQNSEKLKKFFTLLSSLPHSCPRRLQLEFAHLLVLTNQNEMILTSSRQPLRTGKNFYLVKDPTNTAELFALETVFTYVLTPNTPNTGKTAVALRSSDHWVAAPLAWHANLAESSQDLTLIWHAISRIHHHHGDNAPRNQVEAAASCRLRYALSLADVLFANQRLIENIPQSSSSGIDHINKQFSEMLLHSPSDELLIYYSETNKLSPRDLLSLLFRMLDSPKLARFSKLWWRLERLVVTSHDDQSVAEEIHRQWVNGREFWWPAFVEELSLPKSVLKFARKALSALQNL